MKAKAKVIAVMTSLIISSQIWAQGTSARYTKKAKLTENELQRWSHLDLENDSIPGMSIDRVYAELIKYQKGEKVIVGIVDSGVDIDHEDLKSIIWTNEKEIPDNGIDDDNNGYIDDIHGWNFLGDIENENLELTRILKNPDDGSLVYKKAKEEYDIEVAKLMNSKREVDVIFNARKMLSDFLNKENYTIEDIKGIVSEDEEVLKSKATILAIGYVGPEFDAKFEKFKNQVYNQLNYNYNLEYDGRQILGDNANDLSVKNYGNNQVYGPNKEGSLHGTHVAGIIGQMRHNDVGGDGIAQNVEIMSVRAVPNGDEYDKDVALAIRYAVDNGAKVINGSFGKDFSPHKQWVYDAIKYAESKDVLIVHAAGNDSKNIDIESNFPNDSDDKINEFADNVITVGALNYEYGRKIVATFSNYGKSNVDVYAPGVKIYATTPNNTYQYLQGTSMASPNVAGVAAMIRSYYPNLSASEVKGVIMASGETVPEDVNVGGNTYDVRPFDSLSKSGKIVNGYSAMVMAKELSDSKNQKSKLKKKNRIKG